MITDGNALLDLSSRSESKSNNGGDGGNRTRVRNVPLQTPTSLESLLHFSLKTYKMTKTFQSY